MAGAMSREQGAASFCRHEISMIVKVSEVAVGGRGRESNFENATDASINF